MTIADTKAPSITPQESQEPTHGKITASVEAQKLLLRAKSAIESGVTSMRDAAEDIAAAKALGATQREIAATVERSLAWVNGLLKWRAGGYQEATPFGALSKVKRDRAKKRVRSNEQGPIDLATNGQTWSSPESVHIETAEAEGENAEAAPAPERRGDDDGRAVDVDNPTPNSTPPDGDAADTQDSAPPDDGTGEPCPTVEAPPMVPPGALPTSGSLVLPTPGVAFLVGGLKSSVIDVAVKIGAAISSGDEFPAYTRARRGDVVWLSCSSTPRSYLRPKFQAAGANLQAVRYQEAKSDRFGLPIRDLPLDIDRLRQTIQKENIKLRCVIVDHLSEYFRFNSVEKTVKSFEQAIKVLSEVAREIEATVVLPCLVPSQSDEAVAQAVTAAGLYLPVDALFVVKRDDKPNRGSLTPIYKDGTPNGRGFGFALGIRDGERAVVWDAPTKVRSPEVLQ